MATFAVRTGRHLRAARQQAGLSQYAAADLTGLSQGAISGWERGSATPGVRYAFALARAYKVTLDQLLGYHPDAQEGP